jgi:macrolide phosphotransferase
VHRTPLTLAALATAAIPQLDVVATRAPQHDGSDFAVTGLLDAGGRRWVVRSPQHAAAGAALEGEVELLERLSPAVDGGALPFDVPRPAGFADLPEGGRAMVYPELVGAPIDLETLGPGPYLAAQLGRAIAAIHELPAALVESAGLPVYDAEDYRHRRLAEVDEAARTGSVPRALLARWERALEDVTLWRFQATPVHGDLAAEHVLVADDRIVAILDWSEARVGDPAEDLAWLFASAPEAALESVLEAYSLARTERGDAHLAARATLASELALARWLLYGVRSGDDGVVADARRMLADLDELVREAPPIGPRAPAVEPAYAEVEAAAADETADEQRQATEEQAGWLERVEPADPEPWVPGTGQAGPAADDDTAEVPLPSAGLTPADDGAAGPRARW